MNLFILRHASAGTRRPNPLLDVKRPLDKDGKRHCLQLAYVLNAMDIQFDLIVSSNLKRSLQTASLVGTEMGYESPIQISKALAPEATARDFQHLLHECRDRENVLFVGHNPNINIFLGSLLVPVSTHATAQVRLRKGSIARLSLTRGPATLQWLLDPRTVRALYATSTKSSRRKTSKK
nr:histidine phosphatase family protein [Granulicella sp. L56]